MELTQFPPFKSKEKGKDQKSIQSSTTPYQRHQPENLQITRKVISRDITIKARSVGEYTLLYATHPIDPIYICLPNIIKISQRDKKV